MLLFCMFSNFCINLKRSLKLLRLRFLLVRAQPMQYLLKPERLMRNLRKISSEGEKTLPSLLSSMIVTCSNFRLSSVRKLWNLRLKSIVRRSVFPKFTSVILLKRFSITGRISSSVYHAHLARKGTTCDRESFQQNNACEFRKDRASDNRF